jgi:hypothetical protein
MAERWGVDRSTGAVAKKKNVRCAKETDHPMYLERNDFLKHRPPNISLAQRELKDPFNVLWASDDEL